jgi:hypothetical protein
VGLTDVNSTFEILLGICANVGLMFFKCPTNANTQPLPNSNSPLKPQLKLKVPLNLYILKTQK